MLVAGLAAVVTATALEIQAGATAYISGESHWSKAQQDAAYSLYRYAASGLPDDIRRARLALAVPLGDRAGRVALEREPEDIEAAREGFLRGNNAPADINRLIRMYRYFRDAPYFRDAVALWREGDRGVAKLVALADGIEADTRAGTLTAASRAHYQERVLALDTQLRDTELAFSASLVEGSRLLKRFLTGLSIIMFMIVGASAILILRSTLRRIRESEGTFRAAFHQAAVGMLTMDHDGVILDANETVGQILACAPERLRTIRLADIVHADDFTGLARDRSGAIDWTRQATPTEHRFIRGDHSICWIRWTASRVETAHRRSGHVFAIIEDVSEAHQLASEIAHQASHDELTGLINRREIEARLKRAIALARAGDSGHVFFFIDLDQFKLINDTCGHAAGDQLLRQLADVMPLHLRSSDWLGRLGGDEFAVLLEHTTLAAARVIAQRIRTALADTIFVWEARAFNITCSIGIVEISGHDQDVTSVLRAADRACYLAKEDGRNCIRAYEESDVVITRRSEEMAWVSGIRKALAEHKLVLYAQRIEALNGAVGLRYEVLVRLIDEQGRVSMPSAFLPAAEHYGEAIAIDRQVLSMALTHLAHHPAHLRELDLCHINVSAQSIANPEFRTYVADLLDHIQVPPEKLCFELTETAAIANLAHARAFIDTMRARGCKVALDDFGSGLSSYAYLKNLPVDILKIDGVFVRDLAHDEVDCVLVRSMCEVAHGLGKVTIAEWVESEGALARLKELGVDQAQGFAIHEPCPLLELIAASRTETAEALG